MRTITLSFWLLLCGILKINGFDLQCTFTTLSNTFGYAPRTGCKASGVNIQSRCQVVTSVNGTDLKSFTGSGYKSIEIRHQEVLFIPQGLGEFFPGLEGFEVGHSETREVTKSDFAQFPKLKQLYLFRTEIQSLPADLFEGNPELLFIYLAENKLAHVGKGVLTPLKKLHTAYFQTNPCTSMEVIEDRLKIPSLVAALESGCRNDTIDELTKKNNQQKLTSACETLKLQNALDELKRKLESTRNLFDAATRHMFMNPSNCQQNSSLISNQTIDIKCKFNSVDSSCEVYDFVVDTSSLKIAEIIAENGTKIDQSLRPIEKLLIIDQQTLFLPQNLAEMLPKLTELLITDSGFFQIDQKMFSSLILLTSLKITHNKIREIPEQFMSESCNLKELNLTSNRIEVIAEKAFSNLGKLEELDLSHNLLISVHSEVFASLNSLKTLKLNGNKLQILSPKMFFAILELVLLDISDNQIEKLEGDLVSPINKISEFHAANNKVKIVDQKLMKRLKKSQLIDLSGNECIDAIYEKNSTTSIKFNVMVADIFLECSEDEE